MTAKAVGLAVCTGLNSVRPESYGGWSGQLRACEADANSMTALLKKQGFTVNVLLTAKATRVAILKQIADAATVCKPGDIFAFTNSSHGSQLPDLDGDEDDGADETLVAYDAEIIDDEIYLAFGAFKAGVRILMISDSCHSGTLARMRTPTSTTTTAYDAWIPRVMPPDVALATYHANSDFYDPLLVNPALRDAKQSIKASVIQLSACADNQTALDGIWNGLYTGTLLKTWNAGKFKGCYRTLRSKVASVMPASQSPSIFYIGPRNAAFEASPPFSL